MLGLLLWGKFDKLRKENDDSRFRNTDLEFNCTQAKTN